MKKLLTILLIFVMSTAAYAGTKEYIYYVIDLDTNRCLAKTTYEPDPAELEALNQVAIGSKDDIPMEDAEMVNGKIKIRTKSQEEKNAEQEMSEETEEMALIYHRMFTNTYQQLRDEGVQFKYMHKHIDPDDL